MNTINNFALMNVILYNKLYYFFLSALLQQYKDNRHTAQRNVSNVFTTSINYNTSSISQIIAVLIAINIAFCIHMFPVNI